MKAGVGRFLLGLLYGAAWFTALTNTAVLALQASGGSFEPGRFLPLALGAWLLILWVHYTAGWFPFQRRDR